MRIADLAHHVRQGGAFLVVGGIAFVIDAAVYNGLVFLPDGEGPLFDHPLTAKVLAVVIASVVTYFGNKWWTFAHREHSTSWRRIGIFALLNVVAIGLQLLPLAFSRYVLGWDDPVSDNVFGTFIGQILSTGFRYVTYDRFVFVHEPSGDREG